MRAGNREHVSHVAMLTPRTPLHLGRCSRVQRYSSSMHRAIEEDSLMTQYDDDCFTQSTISGQKNIYERLVIINRTDSTGLLGTIKENMFER